MPSLLIYDIAAMQNYSGSSFFQPFPDIATAQSFTNGNTIDYLGTPPPQTVEISDDDAFFNDGDSGQLTVGQDITLEGKTIPAGSDLTPEYSYTLRPAGGTSDDDITIYLFEVGANDIVGFVASSPLEAGTTYTFVGSSNVADVPYANVVTCFGRGTRIATDHGEVAIEDLSVGDTVATRDNGVQTIRWLGSRRLDDAALRAAPNLRPIRIKAGALGDSVPATDLVVSPQHRLLVRSKIAEKMFDAAEVLVAAKHLCDVDGVDVAEDLTEVEYFHMLFDRHEVVVANGAEAESLYTGPEALKSLSQAARDEIFAIFPELKDLDYTPGTARVVANGRMGRKLASRHIQNSKALVDA